MISVTYQIDSKSSRKGYKSETGALKAIWKWLKKHNGKTDMSAIIYVPGSEPRVFDDCEQLPFKDPTESDFYSSGKWMRLRYQAFEVYGNKCACCGANPESGVTLHVDHIKPRSTHPELELDITNLQVLCEQCNIGKLNKFQTQWRKS
ncbi:HNH endonuclease [Shewanella atlantica]|uniref:HNH endonuclease n=1 Tax=Shewanella atlantica TaxID=271099 RepID=A0A431VUU3_9GAMM|nr:HNH endonuclease signature motif containing protein [Shewanella atlantica]RTR27006.1 HNH endonuclease [Shewanella atlantica]